MGGIGEMLCDQTDRYTSQSEVSEENNIRIGVFSKDKLQTTPLPTPHLRER